MRQTTQSSCRGTATLIRDQRDDTQLRTEARLGTNWTKTVENRGEKVNDSGTGRTMHNAPEMRMVGNFKEIQSD